jgi:PII-like signaling protein
MDGEQVLMRVFLGDRDRWEHRSLSDVLVELFKKEGFAGATVLHGTQGFGAHSVAIHKDSILRLSEDLPIVIEVVDNEAKINSVLPKLDEMLGGGLITLEKVRVIRYQPHKERGGK